MPSKREARGREQRQPLPITAPPRSPSPQTPRAERLLQVLTDPQFHDFVSKLFVMVGVVCTYNTTNFSPLETYLRNMTNHKALGIAFTIGMWGTVVHLSKNRNALAHNLVGPEVEGWLIYLLVRAPLFSLNVSVFCWLRIILGDITSAFFLTAFLYELLKNSGVIFTSRLSWEKLPFLVAALFVVWLLVFLGVV